MILERHIGLYTDFYELTMAQGYFFQGMAEKPAAFDYFFRKNPFDGGFVIFAGLGDLLPMLEQLQFEADDLEYLRSQGFRDEFLTFLRNFRFQGTVYAPPEGEVVFPYEPVVRVEGRMFEVQLIETLVLNFLNFQSLIATKAARIRRVAGDRIFLDFGLRRAQGLGGMQATRAAIIGGASGTSNVLAGWQYDIPVSGTQAHSWIQSFPDELTAFRAFAQLYPDRCILLVDTYDTLKSGVPNAITVAKELEAQGHRLLGIRLDSGDLAYLSKQARKMLDAAGLHYVKIFASNQLDEYAIRSLNEQNAPIDGFGVGTRLAVGRPSAALDGVYKLCWFDGTPRLKISEDITKVSLPDRKQVWRYWNSNGYFYADGIALAAESAPTTLFHPFFPHQHVDVAHLDKEPLLRQVMVNGKIVSPLPSVQESAAYAQQRLAHLEPEYQRFEEPYVYKVGISKALMELRDSLVFAHHRSPYRAKKSSDRPLQ